MALLFFDGFDHYNTIDMKKKWDGPGTITAGVGRLGTAGMNSPSPALVWTAVPAADATVVVGFAVKPVLSSAGNSTMRICDEMAADTQIDLTTNTDGSIQIERATTEIARSAPGVLVAGVHQYIEMKAVIDNTVGSVEVRVDGVTVIAASGLDTQATSRARWSIFALGNGNGLDDVYVCDGTGAAPFNDFLGDVHVDTLFPLTDAEQPGTHAQFTPSTGTDHGALVDEVAPGTPASDDYNAAPTAGLRETYRFDPATVGAAVFGLQVMALAAKTETQMVQCAALLIVDGVTHQGETKYPSVNRPVTGTTIGYEYLREVFQVNPNTGAIWAVTTLADIEAGLVRLA